MSASPQSMTQVNERIIVLAPTGQDANLVVHALASEGIETKVVRSVREVCDAIRARHAAALLIAEEALSAEGVMALNEVLGAQEAWSDIPLILVTSSGETTLATLRIKKAFSPAGNISLLERPFRRITLQSIVQVALRSRRKQHEVRQLLEKQMVATRARDEFISIASHELKTPLTSLKLQAELNQRRLTSGASTAFDAVTTQRLVEATSKQVNRLTRLVEDMLDVSRINLGKLQIQVEEFDLVEMVNECIERIRPQTDAAGCEISIHTDGVITGRWDRFRIEQIINNLLSNAIRYCPGRPVAVSVERAAGDALIKVSDHGPGIAPENLERIFERFERAVANTGISGLGLGLYICREIATAHGGSIEVQSEVGRGSSFVLKLPIHFK